MNITISQFPLSKFHPVLNKANKPHSVIARIVKSFLKGGQGRRSILVNDIKKNDFFPREVFTYSKHLVGETWNWNLLTVKRIFQAKTLNPFPVLKRKSASVGKCKS